MMTSFVYLINTTRARALIYERFYQLVFWEESVTSLFTFYDNNYASTPKVVYTNKHIVCISICKKMPLSFFCREVNKILFSFLSDRITSNDVHFILSIFLALLIVAIIWKPGCRYRQNRGTPEINIYFCLFELAWPVVMASITKQSSLYRFYVVQ